MKKVLRIATNWVGLLAFIGMIYLLYSNGIVLNFS